MAALAISTMFLMRVCIITTLICTISCIPAKRTTNDCFGEECLMEAQPEPEPNANVHGDPCNTELLGRLESIETSLQQVPRLLEGQAEIQQQVLDVVVSLYSFLANKSEIQDKSEQPTLLPHTCENHLTHGQHTILPENNELGSFPVVCDMDTEGDGWIVFQRRYDGTVDFDRVWEDYENGFGSLHGEFWLGLNKLHVLTSRGDWELLVELEDFDGNVVSASYDNFRVGDSASSYRLDLGTYSGAGGDSLGFHEERASFNNDGMPFTTKDRDQDNLQSGNCAVFLRGGWWHNACTNGNLNGLYLGQTGNDETGMFWWTWHENLETLKLSELKMRLI